MLSLATEPGRRKARLLSFVFSLFSIYPCWKAVSEVWLVQFCGAAHVFISCLLQQACVWGQTVGAGAISLVWIYCGGWAICEVDTVQVWTCCSSSAGRCKQGIWPSWQWSTASHQPVLYNYWIYTQSVYKFTGQFYKDCLRSRDVYICKTLIFLWIFYCLISAVYLKHNVFLVYIIIKIRKPWVLLKNELVLWFCLDFVHSVV